MINILFVVSNLNTQGPINQLFYLCKYINKTEFNVVLVTTSQNSFGNSMHDKFESLGIEIIDLKLNKIKSVLSSKSIIQKIIIKKHIDIVVSFGFRSDIISSKLTDVVKVTTVRNTLLLNWKMIWGRFLGTIFGFINLNHIKKFDKVIACSYSVGNYLDKLGVKSDVIVNSLDNEKLSSPKTLSERYHLKKQLGIEPEKKMFITISSKLKGKNIEFIIDTFGNNELIDYNLVIAGYTKPETIKKYINQKNIIFIGVVTNLYEYLSAADYFISASTHEGMPNAVLESMATGTPIVLSDIPSHKEIYRTSKIEIGRIFQNNNTNDLLRAIDEIQKLDYYEISNNCIESIRKHYNAKIMSNEYQKYFRDILK